MSAIISAAFETNNVEEIISVGLSQIPARSRFAEMVNDVIEWSRENNHWEKSWEKVMMKYGHYHNVHTINNAANLLIGLLYCRGDSERSISISVMGGLNTDYNGATTGSVIGVMLGARNLPQKWTKSLNDRIENYVSRFNDSRISNLIERTFRFAEV